MKFMKAALEPEVEFSFTHSSGPGGQNVNKVNSKATLHWNPLRSKFFDQTFLERLVKLAGKHCTKDLVIVISSDRFRDQPQNKSDCLDKLEALVMKASKPPRKRKKTKPSRESVRKKHQEKRMHSEKKRLRSKKIS